MARKKQQMKVFVVENTSGCALRIVAMNPTRAVEIAKACKHIKKPNAARATDITDNIKQRMNEEGADFNELEEGVFNTSVVDGQWEFSTTSADGESQSIVLGRQAPEPRQDYIDEGSEPDDWPFKYGETVTGEISGRDYTYIAPIPGTNDMHAVVASYGVLCRINGEQIVKKQHKPEQLFNNGDRVRVKGRSEVYLFVGVDPINDRFCAVIDESEMGGYKCVHIKTITPEGSVTRRFQNDDEVMAHIFGTREPCGRLRYRAKHR